MALANYQALLLYPESVFVSQYNSGSNRAIAHLTFIVGNHNDCLRMNDVHLLVRVVFDGGECLPCPSASQTNNPYGSLDAMKSHRGMGTTGTGRKFVNLDIVRMD